MICAELKLGVNCRFEAWLTFERSAGFNELGDSKISIGVLRPYLAIHAYTRTATNN